MNPTITIIIPVYNVERYLPQCLESILNQTSKDFELILVDDGSTDKSSKIIDDFADRILSGTEGDKVDIKVYHQPNSGVSAARNKGVEFAHGDWLTFIDSDDSILPDYLEKLYSVTLKTDFVLSGDRYLENGVLIREDILPEWSWNLSSNCSEVDIKYLENITSLHGKLFRRDVLLKHNIQFDNTLRFGEDRDFCISYLSNVLSVHYLPYAGYCYNTDIVGSLSKQKAQNLLLTDIAYWNKFHAIINNACPEYQVNRLYNFLLDNIVLVYKNCGVQITFQLIKKVKPLVNSTFLHLHSEKINAPKWLRFAILKLF